jgi:hypothetical protein
MLSNLISEGRCLYNIILYCILYETHVQCGAILEVSISSHVYGCFCIEAAVRGQVE